MEGEARDTEVIDSGVAKVARMGGSTSLPGDDSTTLAKMQVSYIFLLKAITNPIVISPTGFPKNYNILLKRPLP